MKWAYRILVELNKKNSPLFEIFVLFNELYFRIFFLKNIKKKLFDFKYEFYAGNDKVELKILKPKNSEKVYKFLKGKKDTFAPPHPVNISYIDKILRRYSYITFGLYSGNEMMGYVLIRTFFPNRAVFAIGIDKSWQGRGIGSIVAKYIFEFIKKNAFIPFVTIKKDNRGSIKMCEKAGYKIIKDVDDFYVLHG